jgi:DNA-binding IclR family transcriptional regulator
VKSALRVLLIIELLTDEQDGLTFAQICEQLNLPKSSAYVLLQTMKERGHLDLDKAGRYRLGIRVWEAGQAWTRGFDLAAAARPYLQSARDELGETVQLAILDGIEIVYLAKEDSDQRLVLQSHVGARLPAYATGLGKVLLSGLSDDEVLARLSTTAPVAFTPHTIVDPPTLITELQTVRRNGYGMDYGEYTQGVICVAVPVSNDTVPLQPP